MLLFSILFLRKINRNYLIVNGLEARGVEPLCKNSLYFDKPLYESLCCDENAANLGS
jgi:hypothetical protein